VKLITKETERKLRENYKQDSGAPVLKLFGGGAPYVFCLTDLQIAPSGLRYQACTWLISEMYPDGDTLFGLCDLGQGFPEMGTVSLTELEAIQFPPFGLGVERDKFFQADRDLTAYWDDARELGYIAA
jgi:hypothetical protein